ncbi:MAG TPA: type II and III secretion system protein [Bryobacteraceae bacterium]|jgi:general secretion pathway protein D|nr:type II and III secretion system protein [Bryobacteraceae bacterium]
MVKFFCMFLLCAVAAAGADFASRLYQQGLRAERAGDYMHAYLLYARAAALDPKNALYVGKKTAMRGIAMTTSREELGPDPAEKEATASQTVDLSAADLIEAREALPPPRLIGSSGKKTFDLKGDAREIFEKVAAAYGLQLIFDPDYQSPPPITFRLQDATYEDALRALETQANSFLVPVNEKLALVLRDTPQNRTQRSPAMAVAIPIPERMSVQDAQELVTAVQQTFDIRRAQTDPLRRLVYLRDQASKVVAARQLFYMLSRIRPQVEIEVELISVNRNSSLEYGISLPNQISVINFVGPMALPAAANAVARLTGTSTPFGLGIASATVFATLERSSATTLLQSQMVSLDGQAATLHVGSRYPIAANQYLGATGAGAGQIYTPPVQVNFVDLGLELKITPSVNEGGDITLDVDASFKELAGAAVDGIPVIANTQYTGKVRLQSGEWAVLAGLVQKDESTTRTGIPGLADVPVIGKIFSHNTILKDSSDVLLVMKPRMTTLAPWDQVSEPLWVGTESRPLTLFPQK